MSWRVGSYHKIWTNTLESVNRSSRTLCKGYTHRREHGTTRLLTFLLSLERVAAWRAAASGPSRSSRLHPGHPAPPFHRKRISCGATPHHPARRVRGSSTPRPFSREGSPAGPRRLHAALRRTGRRSGRRRPPSQTLPGSAAGGCGRWAARPPLGCLAVRVAPSPPRVGWRRRLTRGSRRRWRRRTTRWRG